MKDSCLEVFRQPTPAAGQPFGHSYSTRVTLRPGEAVAPLAAPPISIRIDDLLP